MLSEDEIFERASSRKGPAKCRFFDILIPCERQVGDAAFRCRSRSENQRLAEQMASITDPLASREMSARKRAQRVLRCSRLDKVTFRSRVTAAPLKLLSWLRQWEVSLPSAVE